jgi:uncharacterized protein with HEPN domain
MSERVPVLLVQDILEAIEDIFEFTDSQTLEAFKADKKTRAAVIRNLEVIGEAANRIPQSLKNAYPTVEWSRIIRSRHILIHEYAGIDLDVVWRIVTNHLPPLKVILLKILNDLQ